MIEINMSVIFVGLYRESGMREFYNWLRYRSQAGSAPEVHVAHREVVLV